MLSLLLLLPLSLLSVMLLLLGSIFGVHKVTFLWEKATSTAAARAAPPSTATATTTTETVTATETASFAHPTTTPPTTATATTKITTTAAMRPRRTAASATIEGRRQLLTYCADVTVPSKSLVPRLSGTRNLYIIPIRPH